MVSWTKFNWYRISSILFQQYWERPSLYYSFIYVAANIGRISENIYSSHQKKVASFFTAQLLSNVCYYYCTFTIKTVYHWKIKSALKQYCFTYLKVQLLSRVCSIYCTITIEIMYLSTVQFFKNPSKDAIEYFDIRLCDSLNVIDQSTVQFVEQNMLCLHEEF